MDNTTTTYDYNIINEYIIHSNGSGTSLSEDDDTIFCVHNRGQRRRSPPNVRLDDVKSTVLCWADPRASKIICERCYAVGHITTQYNLRLHHLHDFFNNYESLSRDDRSRVPCTSYNNERDFFTIKSQNLLTIRPTTLTPKILAHLNLIRLFAETLAHELKYSFHSFS